MENFRYNFVVRVFILSRSIKWDIIKSRSLVGIMSAVVSSRTTHIFVQLRVKKPRGTRRCFGQLNCIAMRKNSQKLGLFFGVFFVVDWKGIAIYNCNTFRHFNYKFISGKSVVFVFLFCCCRQRIGVYVEEIDKLFTIPL